MSTPKEFNLNISERLAAIKLFDEFKGGISQLSQILEDVKSFVITPAEWEAAKLVKTPGKNASGEPVETWNWSDEGTEKVVSVGQESLDYLRSKIKAKSEANELTIADKAVLALSEKIT